METIDATNIIARVCDALSGADIDGAKKILVDEHPFEKPPPVSRKCTPYEMVQVWIRDGFVDRYTGQRLIFPPALRLVSDILPDEIPYHLHGKLTECHIAHWKLTATIDHRLPVSRNGADDMSNWVTTCMLENARKAGWTMEELKLALLPPGDFAEWDGLVGWFLEYVNQHQEHLTKSYVKLWYNTAKRAMANQRAWPVNQP